MRKPDEKMKNVREWLSQGVKAACAWSKDIIDRWWPRLSSLLVFLSLGLVVYCSILFGHLGHQIYEAWNIEQDLKEHPECLAWAASACVLWGVGVGCIAARCPRFRRVSGMMHLLQYLPVAACALVLRAGGFLWEKQTLSVICLAVLLIICVPSWLPPYQRRVESAERDALGRGLLYHQLGDAIRECLKQSSGRGVTVAVTGTWGSGKSHFIHFLEHELQQVRKEGKNVNVCYQSFGLARVDVWKCSSVEAMWAEISESLASCVLERDVRLYGRLGKMVIRVLKALHIPHADLAEDILRIVKSGVGGDSTVTHLLNRQADFQEKAYVLVLDNLDRCDADKLSALLPIIERLKCISHLVTICSVAYGEMAKVDKKIEKVLDGAFLKVFDMVIPMPRVPEKYRKPFMLQELEATKRECAYLRTWCLGCQFPFDSPRLIKAVVDRLSIIDSCFLKRLRPPSADDALMKQLVEDLPKTDVIFALETLRTVSPMFVTHLEGMSDAYSALKLWNKDNDSAKQQLTQLKKIREKNAFPELIDAIVDVFVKKVDKTDFDQAIEQSYLALTSLTPGECVAVMSIYKTMESHDIGNALSDVLHGSYTHSDEPQLYEGLLEFAAQHAEIEKTGEVAGACWEKICAFYRDEQMPKSISAKYGWHMLEGLYHAHHKKSETTSEWQRALRQLLRSGDARKLSEIANALLEYRYDKYPSQETLGAVDLPKALQSPEVTDEANAAERCMRFYFEELAIVIADTMLAGATEKDKQNWIIGQKYASAQYAAWLKQGVLRKLNEQRIPMSDAERIRQQKNILESLYINVWNSNGNGTFPAPFCVLSFATIWAELCRSVFCGSSLTEKELQYVKKALEDLDGSAKEKIEGSDDFRKNRIKSIEILQAALEKLIPPTKS